MSEKAGGTGRTPVLMRVNVTGFQGDAATVFASYDPATDMLLIGDVAKAYEDGERDAFLCVTNQPRDPHHDMLMTEDDLRPSIDAYFSMESQRLLSIANKVQRLNPQSRIQRVGVDSDGMRYQIAPEISCGQVAVMLACLAAQRQRDIAGCEDLMDDLYSSTTI